MKKILTALLALLPACGFCSHYVVCWEESAVEKEVKKITDSGGVVDDIKKITVNNTLKHDDDDSSVSDLKETLINMNLTAHRITYRTTEEILRKK